jgi:hypothetical protein
MTRVMYAATLIWGTALLARHPDQVVPFSIALAAGLVVWLIDRSVKR